MSFIALSLRQAVTSARISKGLQIINFQTGEYNKIGRLTPPSFVRNASSQVNMAKALVIVADGTEEMEAVSKLGTSSFFSINDNISLPKQN